MKIKILYAASNSSNSRIILQRFLEHTSNYNLKLSAFKKSSPKNISIDWTLDSLLNTNESINFDSETFETYFRQVKSFKPDLIISDLEYYTSHVANLLNIPVWQCSSSIISNSFQSIDKKNTLLHTHYEYILTNNKLNSVIHNIIANSSRNLVYSHLSDINNPPSLKPGFEWVRPYYTLGKVSQTCKHNIVSTSLFNNKKIIHLLKSNVDCVLFLENIQEEFPNIETKSIFNNKEYYCNLKNCNYFICEGQTSFLADAYYNGKYCLVFPNFSDIECLINSKYSERQNIISLIYSACEDIEQYKDMSVIPNLNDIKFLHEKINEF